ncbi:hypothetical protein [Hymenobacter negativus]|uniref:VCBS repeat-containing protein n=1 Tax=Hymenobacter negativus TaxID=2795026 RepID=A0ABS3QMZ3_9BACT|nr:hypothetical protein [Hymenobacter negativus]MBO2012472.1 hypothetical protein [Hymenobacter negativus]
MANTASAAYGMVLGDVESDGDLDLVTGSTSGTNVRVRLNNGSGTFGSGSN